MKEETRFDLTITGKDLEIKTNDIVTTPQKITKALTKFFEEIKRK